MPKHEQIPCPRCGTEFECKSGSYTICHCSDINLSKDQMAYINEHWQGCLCHQCLRELNIILPVHAISYAQAQSFVLPRF